MYISTYPSIYLSFIEPIEELTPTVTKQKRDTNTYPTIRHTCNEKQKTKSYYATQNKHYNTIINNKDN